uniref:Myosinlike protein putative n=1 Tax=Albugo laibachii Nc14 TaxID=890382 RepID=F0X0N3_9STRA|nr:myosinlike protein putative [Albugo laibachii Nc14]|eukprot:CCA27326.1 myosinlike protein putative [Albugo laibachii Nc14]
MTMRDLMLLETIDEHAIIEALIKRYQKSNIYTFLGPVLIAINPYTKLCISTKEYPDLPPNLSLYDPELIDRFRNNELHLSPPHPFAIAEAAYSDLMRSRRDQSLIITGESGSGKTETSKHVLQYITSVSERSHAQPKSNASFAGINGGEKSIQSKSNLGDKIWKCNQIFEAFGNAQTIRNQNSSRFGKHSVLQFDHRGRITGAYVENYLLEKCRVFQQASGERNFHIFYQLLDGATSEERTLWRVSSSTPYLCLSHDQDYCTDTSNKVDKAALQLVRQAMSELDIDFEEQQTIFRLLAAILWIGNIRFEDTIDTSQNSCAVLSSDSSRIAIENAAFLLGLPSHGLEKMLTYRLLTIQSEQQEWRLSASKATKVCHALTRSMYEKIFHWIVGRVNHSLGRQTSASACIGILDIYGFEIFQVNGFEQLCINYVNEKLQQLFIVQTLQAEQAEYLSEGLPWDFIPFTNNQGVCELLEYQSKNGIFSVLDEQCAVTQYSQKDFIRRLTTFHADNPHFIKAQVQSMSFGIQHYAGEVEYDVSLFAESNTDTFYSHLLSCMQECSVALVKTLFQASTLQDHDLKRPPTTSQQFRSQVTILLSTLRHCHPNYIRCIKPNDARMTLIKKNRLKEQIRYLGLVENMRLRRKGYCFREAYTSFLHRYKILSSLTWPHTNSHSARQATVALLCSQEVVWKKASTTEVFEEDTSALGSFSLGRNKIFIRNPEALAALEHLREAKLHDIAAILQQSWWRYKKRILLGQFLDAYVELKAAYRAVLTNCMHRRMRRADAKDNCEVERVYSVWNLVNQRLLGPSSGHNSRLAKEEIENGVVYAQSYVRARQGRKRFFRLLQAQITLSKHARGRQVRHNMPPELKQACVAVRLGLRTEFERFLGQKKRRRDTLDREYEGDYLGLTQMPSYQTLLRKRSGFSHVVLFASDVVKVNRRFQLQDRVLVITDTHMLNIRADHPAKPKARRVIELQLITSMELSTLPDDCLLFHINGQADVLLIVEQKTEVVTLIRRLIQEKYNRKCDVTFTDCMSIALNRRNKNAIVQFQRNPSLTTVKYEKKDRAWWVVHVGQRTL